jgi:hypothetical protein
MIAYLARSSIQLLNVTGASGAQTGASRQIRPVPTDDVPNDRQQYGVAVKVLASGGASSPTCQAVIEGSVDGTTWTTLLSGTAFPADGAAHAEILDTTNAALLPYLRAKTVLGGGTAPTSHTVTVEVISNAPFTLE